MKKLLFLVPLCLITKRGPGPGEMYLCKVLRRPKKSDMGQTHAQPSPLGSLPGLTSSEARHSSPPPFSSDSSTPPPGLHPLALEDVLIGISCKTLFVFSSHRDCKLLRVLGQSIHHEAHLPGMSHKGAETERNTRFGSASCFGDRSSMVLLNSFSETFQRPCCSHRPTDRVSASTRASLPVQVDHYQLSPTQQTTVKVTE